jgi:N-methylhydantoinase A
LADALGMSRALVPVNAGVLSALGMLATQPGRQLLRTRLGLIETLSGSVIETALLKLAREGIEALLEEGVERRSIEVTYSLDLRYLGQSYTLNIPWRNRDQAQQDFHKQHQSRYGHRMAAPVELVNVCVALRGPQPDIQLMPWKRKTAGEAAEWLVLPGETDLVPRYERSTLMLGQSLMGPALITEMASTIWVAQGWACEVDEIGNLNLLQQK